MPCNRCHLPKVLAAVLTIPKMVATTSDAQYRMCAGGVYLRQVETAHVMVVYLMFADTMHVSNFVQLADVVQMQIQIGHIIV